MITPEEFKKLDNRKRWDTAITLKNVIWCCEECGKIVNDGEMPHSAWDCEIYCENCDSLLTKRTIGGQNDPFNYTFKGISQIRKEKIEKIFKDEK
jgi:hypothetical protein